MLGTAPPTDNAYDSTMVQVTEWYRMEKVIAEEGYSCDQIYNEDKVGLCMVSYDTVVRCSLIYHCCNVWYAMYIVVLLFTVCFCSVCC